MPYKEITSEEAEEVNSWVHWKKGKSLDGFWYKQGIDPDRNTGTWVYDVGGEPVVIKYRRYTRVYRELPQGPEETRLICSDNHAKELQELGIVNFDEVPH